MKDWWRRTFTSVISILTGSFSLQISMCSLRISALSNGLKHIIKKFRSLWFEICDKSSLRFWLGCSAVKPSHQRWVKDRSCWYSPSYWTWIDRRWFHSRRNQRDWQRLLQFFLKFINLIHFYRKSDIFEIELGMLLLQIRDACCVFLFCVTGYKWRKAHHLKYSSLVFMMLMIAFLSLRLWGLGM